MKPLSYSQISTYQQCPLLYKFQNIDRLEQKDKWYFSFGDTLHKCAEYFFKAKLPSYPTLDQFLSYYDSIWKSEGWESKEEETSNMENGARILKEFWEINRREFRVPLATEKSFNIDVEGVRLRGYIDRLDKLDTGGLAIVDYKSNQDLFTIDYVENFLQLTLYQLACERMWNMPVEKLTLYHLRSNTAVSCGPRSRERINDIVATITSVAENIAAGKFPATENQYCPCDYPEHCTYYKHQYGDPVMDRRQPERLRKLVIADVIERYAAIQEEQKRLESELNELKDLVVQYCKAGEINRVFGREHNITCKVVDRVGYDESKVKDLLKPAGLWDKVLKADPAAVKAMLESQDIPADMREKARALLVVVSSYPRLTLKKVGEDKEEA